MAYDIARKGSLGNRSLLSKYGGSPGSGPAARNKYATGGKVCRADGGPIDDEDDKDMDSGPEAMASDDEPAKPSFDKPGRKMKKDGDKKDKGKTDINIVIVAGGKEGGPLPAGPGGPPPPMPSAGPPPMPPHPPGPPMPMRASGGKVAAAAGQATPSEKEAEKAIMRAKGGAVNMDAGAGGGLGRLEKIKRYGV